MRYRRPHPTTPAHFSAVAFVGLAIPILTTLAVLFSRVSPFGTASPLTIVTATYDPLRRGGGASSTTQPPGETLPAPSKPFPAMTDFWNGAAQWVLDVPNTGLPVGESDTIDMGNGVLWSFLHASTQSAGIIDSCGGAVEFPGCVTRWVSTDGGQHFAISEPKCILRCNSCPCTAEDRTRQQQYPRVVRSTSGMFYMAYEHDAQTWLTTSYDGIDWTQPRVNHKTGLWRYSDGPCTPGSHIGPHPSIATDYKCMAGGPPGLLISGNRLYEFVGLGQNPSHLGCFWSWLSDVHTFFPCTANPLFAGAPEYGPLDARGPHAAPYFDFRYVTSADFLKDGDIYYLTYEGIRGPSSPNAGRDDQFALGFARSMVINGQWETYHGNPALQGVIDNWGIGHADLIRMNGVTYMYTGVEWNTRGRYILVYK